MAFAGWWRQWKYLGGCRDDNGHMHIAFMNMPFIRIFEEAGYEAH